MKKTVHVGRFSTRLEADLARLRLESEGIRATVDEALGFNPILGEALGAVRLVVMDDDAERAHEILEAPLLEDVGGPSTSYRSAAERNDEPDDRVLCPRCELEYTFYERPRVADASARGERLQSMGALFGLGERRWRCRMCLHVWDDPAEGPRTRTPAEAGDPRPVFRLRRNRAPTAALLGIGVGIAAAVVSEPGLVWLTMTCGGAAGRLIGSMFTWDVCSEPTCRAPLARGEDRCERCKGEVAGVIEHSHDHYAEVAAFRRELAASALLSDIDARPPSSIGPAPRRYRRRKALERTHRS